jgi:hypothetical protein
LQNCAKARNLKKVFSIFGSANRHGVSSLHAQVDISNNGIQTLPGDDENLIVVTGADDDGLRNMDDALADLAEELNKEDGPRIQIIVDQKV